MRAPRSLAARIAGVGVVAMALAVTACAVTFPDHGESGGGGPSGPGSGGSSPTSSTSTEPTSSASTGTSTSGHGGSAATAGGGGEGEGGGTGGAATTCDVPSDCQDDNPCTDDGCVDGLCRRTPIEDQVLVDDPHDCRTVECFGGDYVDEPADEEDPADANPPCEETVCDGGEPTPSLADDTTECGPAPQQCDGAGLCVGCDPRAGADECGDATDCASPTCEEPGVCDPGYLPDTTSLDDDAAGDCRQRECTGRSAAPASVPDDTDEPDDLPCGDRSCTSGAPSTLVVAAGMTCLVGTGVCDGAGTSASSCKTCRDTDAGGGVDQGCSAGTPVCNPAGSGSCAVCHLDGATSVGCRAGTVCDESAAAGDGECVECVDEGGGLEDVGCMSPTPACSAVASCVECQVDLDCTAFDRPNGDRCNRLNNTACGCIGNADCANSPQGTLCRTTSGNRCGCLDANDCDHAASAGPSCANGTCGP